MREQIEKKYCMKRIPYKNQRTITPEYYDVLSTSNPNKGVLRRVQETCGPMVSEQENIREK